MILDKVLGTGVLFTLIGAVIGEIIGYEIESDIPEKIGTIFGIK